MTSKAALFALLAMWGVGGACLDVPAFAEDSPTEAQPDPQSDHSPAKRSFTNRVWVKTETGDLPGVMKIFLSDGTLVQDSCWETHRLSTWNMESDTGLSWNEDGMDIKASIASVSSSDLHLVVSLGAEQVDEHYTAATVPYVCPDMPKS
jgi:hypothetical protein